LWHIALFAAVHKFRTLSGDCRHAKASRRSER
jgi:hypothetical protein